ncbi:zinc-binding alcohol dehydrogenase family protein [Fredinandcohnia sp. QZ13]|uniref:zinc-binding alcohol dehydrogenase family protein n=1 Tax=Fredinandcohnia sp. QZ13 TaxID=3073144 RepID=UPI0028535720|nr:zinc-binding alcohol dehydrogenase family protein [Fredinandcohnia sp. QZ13]MDR4889527.1 zinc-binding alcohol dehydrogenase family protein [Fredinandcohnia sp. QZ13]
MKTIVCQEPGNMRMIEQESPTSIGEKDIMIRVKRIGICGTDLHAFGGNQPFFQYPRVLGHELSGIVEKVGGEVQSFNVGDCVSVIPYIHCGVCIACKNGKTNCCTRMQVTGVHIDGGMTEYLVFPESHVIHANGLSLNAAAIIEPLSIGAHAVRRAQIQKGESVLIIGAGPIGLGTARFAKLQGAKTIMMDISKERLAFAKDWTDCDQVLEVGSKGDLVKDLLTINDGHLPTIVMDATGNKHSMMNAFNYVSHGGKLIYVGLVKDQITFNDPDFHAKELTLMGSRNATIEDFKYVMDCMNQGSVDIDTYITHKIPFEKAAEYFQAKMYNTNKVLIELE